jgi:hypothetical protein
MLGIDYAVGKETSILVVKTMKLVYLIDEYTITQQPKCFVDALVKLVGKSTANLILYSITEQIKRQALR